MRKFLKSLQSEPQSAPLLTDLSEPALAAFEVFVHPFLVHAAGFDDLVDLEEDEPVSKVAVEVVDVGVRAKTVHPVAVH